MCDLPSVFEARVVTARKRHRCYECTRTMAVGERHVVASGIWDGTPDRFRICLSCDAIRRWLTDGIQSGRFYGGGEEECGVPFGELKAMCFEALHEWNLENPDRAIGSDIE